MIRGLEITEITLRTLPAEEGPLRAYVRLVLNDAFVINGLRVVAGKTGLFVAFPRQVSKGKPARDICHPISREVHEYFAAEVLREYTALVGTSTAVTKEAR